MKLPIGISDFQKLIEGGFEYVDKSLLIQEVINDTDVILITRPRRFGKTLQLSMLKYFFSNEVKKETHNALFQGLNISRSDLEILEHQRKYPVVSISFKDIKHTDFKGAYEKVYELISWLYDEFSYLQNSPSVSEKQKVFFKLILDKKASQAQLEDALQVLTHCLFNHYGINPIVLIDEYDTPIQQGYTHGYYKEIIQFFKNVLGKVLKDNIYLHKAVLTGILRISKESMFSDLNNIQIYTLLHPRYSQYFGFTESEVMDLLEHAHMQKNRDPVRTWYNGYQFGDLTIYNPWSILKYIADGGALQPYWVNTSDNSLIKDLLLASGFAFKSKMELLLQGFPFKTFIDDHIVFKYLNANETAIWTLFLMAGYLKVEEQEYTEQGLICQLAIPNREVHSLFRRIIESWLSDGRALDWYNQFLQALLHGKIDHLQRYLSDILLQIASCHDMAREPEAFYHGLMLGLTASLHNDYEIKSNRESGFGFYDITIIPKDVKKLGIVIELKASELNELEKTADTALKQISDKHYAMELVNRDIRNILKLGISFSGKKLHIAHQLS